MHPEFGIFEPVFTSPHGYLALLNLSSNDSGQAVQLVRDCCRKAGDPQPAIRNLLTEPNWRPHLVASVAAIVTGGHTTTAQELWDRIDAGSWVTPQIAVALYLVDSNFASQARTRLEAGCALDISELIDMTPAERHSAAGPAGEFHRSAKAAAALLRLLEMISPAPAWLNDLRASESVKGLVAQDLDDSAGIAERWLNRIRTVANL